MLHDGIFAWNDWPGRTGAELKNGIDNIFGEHGPLSLPDYNTNLISCSADGAAVNFGTKSGLLTRLDADRGWLINIHCSNHRIELAVKDAFKNSVFVEIDTLYNSFIQASKKLWKKKVRNENRGVKSSVGHVAGNHNSTPKCSSQP